MHSLIRSVLAEKVGPEAAKLIRILYGGSVNSGNAAGFLRQEQIDGLLIGTASIKVTSFLKILKVAQAQTGQQSEFLRKQAST